VLVKAAGDGIVEDVQAAGRQALAAGLVDEHPHRVRGHVVHGLGGQDVHLASFSATPEPTWTAPEQPGWV
jgi:hypothetical protein